ncbi:MAG TPA: bacteriohopanetetrol glucosamine biosynthesis glycosyltransferase HpnI [Terriglobales bacterium]
MLTWFLLCCAIAGLVASTGFLVLIIVAAVRLRARRVQSDSVLPLAPGVTLLKPLCGLEPNLRQNLVSFFDQDYPKFEIIFGTRNGEDPALELVHSIQNEFPGVPVKIVFSGEPDRPNAKVCSLEKMYEQASYDYLFISDSDVQVTPDYIREVVSPLLDPSVGLVWCPYRGMPTGGIWSGLEALGMSVEMTSGVIVADLLNGMDFALGPTMAIRREVLDSVGGMGSLADYCADDFVLGNEVYKSGRKVVMSDHIIDHVVMNRSFKSSMLHQLRWTKSTRFSRPAGYFSSVLTYAMPFGIFGAIAALAGGMPVLAASLLGWAVLNRMIMAMVAGYGVVRDRRSLVYSWVYPLRDLQGFLLWCGSYWGKTVDWRGEKYRLVDKGKMVRVGGDSPASTESAVTVNNRP